MCMCTCLAREAKVKVDVTDRCTRSYRGTSYHCSGCGKPQASARDEVVVVSRARADESASLVLGSVAAGADQPLRRLWVGP